MSAPVNDDYTGRPLAVTLPFYGDDPMHRPLLPRTKGTLWERVGSSGALSDWLWNGGKRVEDDDLYRKQQAEERIAWGEDL